MVTKGHKLSGLNRNFLSSSPRSRDQQGHAPPEGSWKDLFQPLSLLLVVSWLVAASLQSPHGLLPVCTAVSKFPPFLKTPVILD